jgi:glycerophosphoryl diester phosphodiesterase
MKRKTLSAVVVFGLIFLGLVSGMSSLAADTPNENAYRVETVAHRGAAGYAPECTMAAFQLSFEMKADYLELDVQLTIDGKLVVIHDITVDRTTDGVGYVGGLTFEEIRMLDAGSWFSEEFAGEQIPTLDEVLDEFRGKIGILIEIKSPELYPGIELEVANKLIERNMHKPENEKIIVQSFGFDSMKLFHEILPEIPIGVLTYSAAHHTDEMLEDFMTYADYVNPYKSWITPAFVDRIHAYGMGVMPWTVRDPAEVAALLEAFVDGIITDYPDYPPRNKYKPK